MMNCLIVDDEEMARKNLLRLCNKIGGLNVVSVCENALEAIDCMEKESIDLLLLDIEMPEFSGMELVKHYQNLPQIIFTTSMKDFAVEAFEFDVTDYLTKPIQLPRFVKAIERAKNNDPKTHKSSLKEIILKEGNKQHTIAYNDILFLENKEDEMIFHLQDGQQYSSKNELKSLRKKMLSAGFDRINPTIVVNVSKVDRVDQDHLEIGKKRLPISPVFKPITSKW